LSTPTKFSISQECHLASVNPRVGPAMGIRILTLNIRHGGGKRIARLADWIASKSPNVVVLPEWRNDAPGQRIREILTDSGFRTIVAARGQSAPNSVLLAAMDLTESWEVTPANSTAGDLILIEIAKRIRILGCYFPQRQAKAPFFQQCIELASKNRDLPFVMIGDFNTGRNDLDIDGAGAPFYCADLFRSLGELGLIDLWRARHGDRREWTWRSPANGFRIDHAFGNEAFIKRFPAFQCEIDHSPRLAGLTDHSAVVLEAD
jgi:exodeoxyribonuclease III